MKTKGELTALKEEVEALSRKLQELTDEELDKVTGGASYESATGRYEITCSTPGCMFNLDIEPTCWDPSRLACSVCKTGTLSYTFTPYGS